MGATAQDDNRRLRAEFLRAREDLALTRERLAYTLHQVADLRKRIPGTVTQAAAPGGTAVERPTDPLERLFAAIRPAGR